MPSMIHVYDRSSKVMILIAVSREICTREFFSLLPNVLVVLQMVVFASRKLTFKIIFNIFFVSYRYLYIIVLMQPFNNIKYNDNFYS